MRQADKEKKISPEFHSYPTRVRKFQKKNSKKIQETKKHHSGIISIKTGMRQAEKEKKKKISSRISFLVDLAKKIPKKKKLKN